MTTASITRPVEPALVAFAAGVASVVFLFSWTVLHRGFYEREQIVDTRVYERYGSAMSKGEIPYRDFALEYPPGALPVFVLPAVGGADFDTFTRRFEGLMAACGLALVAFLAAALAGLGANVRRLAAALVFAALAPLALGSVVLSRFDLWPAALTAAALAAFLSGRDRLGHAALGAAVAVKLYPAVLVPVALAYVWRRNGQREAL
ncbi:MAG: glycosyltransferase 87 family protein, partial [Gaiellaceae bacterium]